LVSLAMFLLAFSANSLLVFYFGFLGLKLSLQSFSFSNLGVNELNIIVGNLDYIVLPFLFWFSKEKFAPRHGSYKSYNRIRLNPIRIALKYINAIRSGFEAAISDPIRSVANAHLLWIPITAAALAFYFPGFIPFDAGGASKVVSIEFLTIGVILFLLAALPYILIDQNFAPGGFSTKHHLLFHLPVSMILFGIICLLSPPNTMTPVMVFLLLVNVIHLNSVYLYYIAVSVKDRSWLYKLSKFDTAKANSLFYILDNHSIQGDRFYPQDSPAYSFYMFDWLWSDKSHVGITVRSSRIDLLNDKQISELLIATTLDYDMQDVDVHGRQAKLEISNGLERSPINVAFKYLREKYLPGGNVERILDRVCDLDYARL